MVTAFYQTAAQLSFTLLGLWWLVLQTKYREWIGDQARRRLATIISLYFLLPGSMSLLGLLGSNIPLVWRTSFAVACALGVVATLPLPSGRDRRVGGRRVAMLGARWLGVVLYVGVFVVAVSPPLSQLLGLAPLIVAGIGLTLLVVLGVSMAWIYFTEQPPSGESQRSR